MLKTCTLFVYTIGKTLECAKDSLELLVLDLTDWPFWVLMSIAIAMLYCTCGLEGKLKTKEKCIFASSLLGAIIQDGSIRERSVFWQNTLSKLSLAYSNILSLTLISLTLFYPNFKNGTNFYISMLV